ncbi:MAG: hypothetical protein KDK36_18220, partial [Leptospiraceae bacterium]|nr:hypothetical protein [Leptospiraceae bacterium]
MNNFFKKQSRIIWCLIYSFLFIILANCTPAIYDPNDASLIEIESRNGKKKYFPKNSKWIGFEENFDLPLKELSQFHGIESLEIKCPCVKDLKDLPYIPNLKYLNLSGTKINSLKKLQNWKHIDVLILSGTEIENLQDIKKLNKIIWLRLDHTKIKNLKFLKYFPEL